MDKNKIDSMKFNDYEVVLDKDIKKYPFLIFEPVLCNSYILRNLEETETLKSSSQYFIKNVHFFAYNNSLFVLNFD